MPLLQRRAAGRLLRQVGGKAHATNDDHVEQVPTPPASNNSATSAFVNRLSNATDEDFTRSPESSGDEKHTVAALEHRVPAKRSSFKTPRQGDNTEEGNRRTSSTSFRRPGQPPSSPHSTQSKRSREEQEGGNSSDGDAAIFGSKKHKSSSSTFTNIHANSRRNAAGYGKKEQRRSEVRKGLKLRRAEEEVKIVEPPRPKFRRVGGMDDDDDDDDVFVFGSQGLSSSGFRTRGALHDGEEELAAMRDSGPLSPSLSSISQGSSSPIVMAGLHNADFPSDDGDSTLCAICDERIPLVLAMAFRQQFTQGSPIVNYRWQQRFCRWHRQEDARRTSADRGYPDIDWKWLPARMRKCERHLKQVIRGETASFWQDQLAEILGSGMEKTTLAALVVDGEVRKDGTRVGYYGPKGERIMIDHIISHLSADIRKGSSRNRLIATAGVSGGVSGFVQAVLVPELAERLICEDLKVECARAREVMTESAEIGELLHPDANDWVGAEADDEVITVED